MSEIKNSNNFEIFPMGYSMHLNKNANHWRVLLISDEGKVINSIFMGDDIKINKENIIAAAANLILIFLDKNIEKNKHLIED